MPLPSLLLKYIQDCLTVHYGRDVSIASATPVSGGDINAAYCLQTNVGKLMMKLNSKSSYPNMFAREAEGLAAIRNTQTLAVPEVIYEGNYEDDSFLIMEWIDTQRPDAASSEQLGRDLAAMHRNSAPQFGFHHNNYMGSLSQSNRRHDTWAAFFVEERLQPMLKIAVDKGLLNKKDIEVFTILCRQINDFFDEKPPSLIHGDLWSGNYFISTAGKPYLIDPAVSYGHREFDIAMTTLFGGFSDEFYDAYNEAYPLAADWEQRLDLWNLYPLLLHLNLFGVSYLGQVRGCLRRYV